MKTLTLIRHAQAAPATSNDQDWDRPLEKKGERDAAMMAQRLKSQHVKPTLIIASPATRTAHTADIFAAALKIPLTQISREERLYLCSPAEFLKVIREKGGTAEHVMIFGHNPGISEFADQLDRQRRIENIPTSGIVTVQFDIEDWSQLELRSAQEFEFDYPGNM
jgi:phosphohistidine phosphatase